MRGEASGGIVRERMRLGAPAAGTLAGAARWVAAGLLAAAVAIGAATALRPAERLGRTPVVEDGYYALAVARHAALGHGLTIDGERPTNGVQPGWVLLDAPLHLLARGDRWTGLRLTLALSTLLWLAFACLLAVIVRDRARALGLRGDVAAVAALVVALGSVSVFRVFHNGLETGLQLVAVLAAVVVLDRLREWTPRATLLAAAALAAAAWARLDTLMLVAAVGAVAAWRARAERRVPWGPIAACALAVVSLAPWIARNLALDGHPMPTSGRAESLLVDVSHNAEASLRALGSWALAPLYRAPLHRELDLLADAGALVALTVLASAFVLVGRRARVAGARRPGLGTAALRLYVGGLVAFYTAAFGSWWSLDRYLAPMLLVATPAIACTAEILWRSAAGRRIAARRGAVAAALAAVAVANAPLLGIALAAPPRLPTWASPATNLGTHENDNYFRQTRWTLANVAPRCVVGARQSGTLGYFRDRVVNLDGKVDAAALRAREAGRLRAYVDEAGIDVVVDVSGLARHVLGPGMRGFRRTPVPAGYEAWVREGREDCLRGRSRA